MDGTLCLLSNVIVMGNQDDGIALCMEFMENIDDLLTGLGIQRTGRLIGKDQLRIGYNGTGNGHALLLTAGEFRRQMLGPVGKANRSNASFTRFCRSARGTF